MTAATHENRSPKKTKKRKALPPTGVACPPAPPVPPESDIIVHNRSSPVSIRERLSSLYEDSAFRGRYPDILTFLIRGFTIPSVFVKVRERIREISLDDHDNIRPFVNFVGVGSDFFRIHPVFNTNTVNTVIRPVSADFYLGEVDSRYGIGFSDLCAVVVPAMLEDGKSAQGAYSGKRGGSHIESFFNEYMMEVLRGCDAPPSRRHLETVILLLLELIVTAYPKPEFAIPVVSEMGREYVERQFREHRTTPAFVCDGNQSGIPVVNLSEKAKKALGESIQLRYLSTTDDSDNVIRFFSYIGTMLTNPASAVEGRALAKASLQAERKFCTGLLEQDILEVGFETNAYEFILERYGISTENEQLGEEATRSHPFEPCYSAFHILRDVFLEVVSWSRLNRKFSNLEKEINRRAEDIYQSFDLLGEDKPVSLRRYDADLIKHFSVPLLRTFLSDQEERMKSQTRIIKDQVSPHPKGSAAGEA